MNIPREANLRGVANGHATQRRRYVARVQRFLRTELATLEPQIPMCDLLPVALRIYRKAYDLGYHADYNRRRRAPARQS